MSIDDANSVREIFKSLLQSDALPFYFQDMLGEKSIVRITPHGAILNILSCGKDGLVFGHDVQSGEMIQNLILELPTLMRLISDQHRELETLKSKMGYVVKKRVVIEDYYDEFEYVSDVCDTLEEAREFMYEFREESGGGEYHIACVMTEEYIVE